MLKTFQHACSRIGIVIRMRYVDEQIAKEKQLEARLHAADCQYFLHHDGATEAVMAGLIEDVKRLSMKRLMIAPPFFIC